MILAPDGRSCHLRILFRDFIKICKKWCICALLFLAEAFPYPLDSIQPVVDTHLYTVRQFLRGRSYLLLLIVVVHGASYERSHVEELRQSSTASGRILAYGDALGDAAGEIGQSIEERSVLESLVRAVQPGTKSRRAEIVSHVIVRSAGAWFTRENRRGIGSRYSSRSTVEQRKWILRFQRALTSGYRRINEMAFASRGISHVRRARRSHTFLWSQRWPRSVGGKRTIGIFSPTTSE